MKFWIIPLLALLLSGCDLLAGNWQDLHFMTVYEATTWVSTHISYIHDIDQYGRSDYWATPEETFNSRKGDCEDYCILAMAILENNFSLGSRGHLTLYSIDQGDGYHAIIYLDTTKEYFDLVANTVSPTNTYPIVHTYTYDQVMNKASTTH